MTTAVSSLHAAISDNVNAMTSTLIRTVRRSPCPVDQYFDSVVERCGDCFDACSSPTDLKFCIINCPGYYRQRYGSTYGRTVGYSFFTTTTSVSASAAAVGAVNPLFQHPLFWTFIVSTTIATIALAAIVVLCAIRCRQAHQQRMSFFSPRVFGFRRQNIRQSTDSNFQKKYGNFKDSDDVLTNPTLTLTKGSSRHEIGQQQTDCLPKLLPPNSMVIDKTGSVWNEDYDQPITGNLHSDVRLKATVESITAQLFKSTVYTDGAPTNYFVGQHSFLGLTPQSLICTTVTPPKSVDGTENNGQVNNMPLNGKSDSKMKVKHIDSGATDSIDLEQDPAGGCQRLSRPLEVVDDELKSLCSTHRNLDSATTLKMICERSDLASRDYRVSVSRANSSKIAGKLPQKNTTSTSPSSLLLVSGASFEESVEHNRVAYVIQQPLVSNAGFSS